ncbi:hypothetical protein Bbelb_322890 [Branchiostoma belcheri]|nr:hypothetical protein Bbelb_322890 [Branchiostoma belcheri]
MKDAIFFRDHRLSLNMDGRARYRLLVNFDPPLVPVSSTEESDASVELSCCRAKAGFQPWPGVWKSCRNPDSAQFGIGGSQAFQSQWSCYRLKPVTYPKIASLLEDDLRSGLARKRLGGLASHPGPVCIIRCYDSSLGGLVVQKRAGPTSNDLQTY